MSPGLLLIGFGARGRQWADAVGARRGTAVTGVVDPAPEARSAAADRGLRTFEGLDEALSAGGATAAIIASPPARHAGQALACLRAGLGVLVEKPLALTVEDARAVAAAARAAGRPAVVGHDFRHRRVERALRRALDDGAVGPLRVATVASARPASAPGHDLGPHAPLWDLGVHHLDLLRVRFGAVPDVVRAGASASSSGTTHAVRLEWEGRAAADYWLHEGASVYHHAEWLEGPRGALRAVDGRAWLVSPRARPQRLRAPRAPHPQAVLLDALLGEADPEPVGAADGVGTVAILEAAVRSLACDEPVRTAGLLGAPA